MNRHRGCREADKNKEQEAKKETRRVRNAAIIKRCGRLIDELIFRPRRRLSRSPSRGRIADRESIRAGGGGMRLRFIADRPDFLRWLAALIVVDRPRITDCVVLERRVLVVEIECQV